MPRRDVPKAERAQTWWYVVTGCELSHRLEPTTYNMTRALILVKSTARATAAVAEPVLLQPSSAAPSTSAVAPGPTGDGERKGKRKPAKPRQTTKPKKSRGKSQLRNVHVSEPVTPSLNVDWLVNLSQLCL